MIVHLTNTLSGQELQFLAAALNKAADRERAAIRENRACGYGNIADEQQKEVDGLVGADHERSGTTLERVLETMAKANGGAVSFSVNPAEKQAIAVGLPLVSKRMRAMCGEVTSFGCEDWKEWLEKQSAHIDGVLLAHYVDQQELKLENGDGAQDPDGAGA